MPTPNPYFLYPWCSLGASGDITPISNTGVDSGTVNYQYGFTPNYEYPSTNPSNLPVPRQSFNQLMLDVTNALQQLQTQGYPLWVAAGSGGPPLPTYYPIYSVVAHNYMSGGIQIYESQINANNSEPGADNNWVVISGGALQIQSGMIIDYAGTNVPTGFLLCDGTAPINSRSLYSNLYDAIVISGAATTNSTNTISGAFLGAIGPGMPIEGTGIPANTTVVSEFRKHP